MKDFYWKSSSGYEYELFDWIRIVIDYRALKSKS